jgi:2C-methyl-D-erythritol 2,4-cyclodiphosphate synthase
LTATNDQHLLAIRTGLGYDSHRLAEGERLVLGGVDIPHTHGLVGHFPDTDPRYRNADSMVLLARVVLLVSEGHVLLNVDSTIHAERPKMVPHIPAMRGRLAAVLGLPQRRVNVKAKTGEGVGTVGTGEAIETTAIATLAERDAPTCDA